MGASSSFLESLNNSVYISYDIADEFNKDLYLSLFNCLEQEHITIITSKNLMNNELNYHDYLNNMNEIVHSVPFIIVCLTNNYLKCVQQIKELNQILDREKNILYLRIDNNNNEILNQPELNSIIKSNDCLLLKEKNFYEIVKIVKLMQ